MEIQNLSFTYPGAESKTLDGISLRIEEGDFVVICGPTGSGKTTLMHHLKNEIRPVGIQSGDIIYKGQPLGNENDPHILAQIGLVFQDPEQQFVMETVRQELAFGLENHGLSHEEIHKRIGELVSFFGLEDWLDRDVHQLSGGQKQWVNLAAVLLLRPKLLLLDEPTSQLDPVSTRQFIQLLQRLNEEFSITLVVTEHRLDDLYSLANHIVMMDQGQIVNQDDPRHLCEMMAQPDRVEENQWKYYFPQVSRTFLGLKEHWLEMPNELSASHLQWPIPLTVKEGRSLMRKIRDDVMLPTLVEETLSRNGQSRPESEIQPTHTRNISNPVLSLQHVSFQYEKRGRQILDRLTLQVRDRGMMAILGGNGSGKSTLLKVMLGLLQPQHGKVLFQGKPVSKLAEKDRYRSIGYLDQNPLLYFTHDTVEKSLQIRLHHLDLQWSDRIVSTTMDALQWDDACLTRHPYDLSGGERQKTALLFTLISDPTILLLDEPTKGLDPQAKSFFGQFLKKWSAQKTVVLVSHDLEFAAEYATHFSMLFDGQLTAEASASAFFGGNYYYTTSVHRVFGEYISGAVTRQDVMTCFLPH